MIQHQELIPQGAHLIQAAAVLAEPGKGLFTDHCVDIPETELQPTNHLRVALALGIVPERVELVNGPIPDVLESRIVLGLLRKTAIAIVTKAIAMRIVVDDFGQPFSHCGVVLRLHEADHRDDAALRGDDEEVPVAASCLPLPLQLARAARVLPRLTATALDEHLLVAIANELLDR
eukprot:98127-Heterocapsa_arctica.AAC.1